MESLNKEALTELLPKTDGVVRELLMLRAEMSRSSVAKYQKMLDCVRADGRVHGLHQFIGAGRTGRWAGRLLQTQNLPRNYLTDLEGTRSLVKARDTDSLSMIYTNTADTLSQLIRTALIPAPGNRFIVADYSAIEARVLAWLAGERWVLDAFRSGEDIYCTTASQMFGVPVEKHGANAEVRQKGKIATLACGYGGSVGALTKMGADKMGLSKDEMHPIVDAWREANPSIVDFWYTVDKAANEAIDKHTTTRIGNIVTGRAQGWDARH